MIKISNNEASYLREKGMGRFIKKSYTKHPTYFLVEDGRAMSALRKFKESRIVKEG